VFIDEIDALASKRMEIGTSGEREVERTFMQFLAEIDGFEPLENVKVIGCTNRKDILDPAIVRPGRLDRLIHVPLPTKEGIREVLKIHTRKMNLHRDVSLDELAAQTDGASGADIRAICTEAGMYTIREKRVKVKMVDFRRAVDKVVGNMDYTEKEAGLMFG
jgi:proteasome regulatory subunit